MATNPTVHQMLGNITANVDALLKGQDDIKADIDNVKIGMEALRAEDTRIDTRVSMNIAIGKAYIAGIASVFTAIGTVFGAAMTYVFGIK